MQEADNTRAATAAAVAAEAATIAAGASTDAAVAKAAALVGADALTAHGHRQAATQAATAISDAATAKAAATTASDALTALGQRGINRIWEFTQALIALTVVAVTMVVVLRDGEIPPELAAIAVSIVSTYFTRTNHSAVGGVGPPAVRRGE